MSALDHLRRAKTLADRWVRAWGSGYEWGWASSIHFEEDTKGARIALNAQPTSGGIGVSTSFAASYLDDDTGFEEAARVWKAEYDNKRAAEWALEKQLEASPDVQAYLKLKGYHPYGRIFF